jgi:phage terminase small subunit
MEVINMAGRSSKPTQLILIEKKSHRTKEEIKQRQEAEEALFTGQHFREKPQVKNNEIAHKEFLRLKKLYKKIAYVDALDEQMINRYCLEVANAYDLQKRLASLEKLLTECENSESKIAVHDMINKTVTAMNRTGERLLKYEDRLFLNPTARIKAIPKSLNKKTEVSGMGTFLKGRAGG